MRAAAEVDGDDANRFVHRHDEVAGAVDAAARAERGLDRLAERDADVLDRVVLVDVEIALGAQAQVEAAVAREQLQHVVEKADAGPDVVSAAAVERQPDGDRRFRGLPFNHAAPHRTSSSASMHAWVCSTTPVVMRTHPGHAGSRDLSRTCTPRAARPVDDG